MLQEASQGYKSSESVHSDGHRGGTTGRQTIRGQWTERTWGRGAAPSYLSPGQAAGLMLFWPGVKE